MHPSKAPGADGFTAGFYQKDWDLVKREVYQLVQGALSSDAFPREFAYALVVLIPKVKHPESIKQFCPISLLNVLGKLIMKTLVNRVRPFLHTWIGPYQSSFIPGRSAHDNILVVQEVMHYINS